MQPKCARGCWPCNKHVTLSLSLSIPASLTLALTHIYTPCCMFLSRLSSPFPRLAPLRVIPGPSSHRSSTPHYYHNVLLSPLSSLASSLGRLDMSHEMMDRPPRLPSHPSDALTKVLRAGAKRAGAMHGDSQCAMFFACVAVGGRIPRASIALALDLEVGTFAQPSLSDAAGAWPAAHTQAAHHVRTQAYAVRRVHGQQSMRGCACA